MSRAFTNPVFQQDLERWKKFTAGTSESVASCLRCHAPAAVLSADGSLRNPSSREGVTCTICHRVAQVRERDGQHFLVMDPRNIVYGTGNARTTDAHRIRHSAALSDSSLCAGCHLDISNGIPLEYTWHEWKTGPYAKQGVQCMGCHMPPVPNSDSAGTHRSHRFPGGHSTSELLKQAATIELVPTGKPNQILATVTNVRVGHHFPTGGAHPSRLVLYVSALDPAGKVIFRDHRDYRFQYLNAQGNIVKGRQQAHSWVDSTLKPLQTRQELFQLPSLPNLDSVRANLVYELLPADLTAKVPYEYCPHYTPVTIDEVRLPLHQ